MLKKDIPTGIVVYRGPSQIDGAPIRVIITGFAEKSENEKTGPVLQSWIVRSDVVPYEAVKSGKNHSVCHSLCPHKNWGSCYVCAEKAPTSVFGAYHRDSYVDFDIDKHSQFFIGRKIRLGSYGDPGAVPISVWKTICSLTNGHSGYTELWRTNLIDQDLKNYCMASTVSIAEKQKAKSLGWRTFRVRPYDSKESCIEHGKHIPLAKQSVLMGNEAKCPASKEAGYLTNCSNCGACMGLESKTKKDICIVVHGLDHKIEKFRTGLQNKIQKKKCTKEFSYPPKKKKVKKSIKVKRIVSKVKELV